MPIGETHYQAPQWVRNLAPSVKLDWGATLHPIDYENLKKLVSEDTRSSLGVKDDELSFVSNLDSHAQYAVVWVEAG
jgi:SPX domain protein involved in polyphosphate accumulation